MKRLVISPASANVSRVILRHDAGVDVLLKIYTTNLLSDHVHTHTHTPRLITLTVAQRYFKVQNISQTKIIIT